MSVTRSVNLERLSDEEAENRCFPTKAVAVWRQLDDRGHVRLIESYLDETGNFENLAASIGVPRLLFSDPLYAVIGESTGAQAT